MRKIEVGYVSSVQIIKFAKLDDGSLLSYGGRSLPF